jgi:uncharacterized membrane protein YhaH (DUF805 family)
MKLSRIVSTLGSPLGRMTRSAYVPLALGVVALFALVVYFLRSAVGPTVALGPYPVFGWALVALSAKRLHDVGRSAAWLALVVVPVVGPLVLALKLFFARGTSGENQYGDDPRLGRDYLVVRP